MWPELQTHDQIDNHSTYSYPSIGTSNVLVYETKDSYLQGGMNSKP